MIPEIEALQQAVDALPEFAHESHCDIHIPADIGRDVPCSCGVPDQLDIVRQRMADLIAVVQRAEGHGDD